MNKETGEIKLFDASDALQQAILSGNWTPVTGYPKESCRRCHGRGHTGRNLNTGQFSPCPCISPAKERDKSMNRHFDAKRYETLTMNAMKARVDADLYDWRAKRLVAVAILRGEPLGCYNDGEDGSIYFLGGCEITGDIFDELGDYAELEWTPATEESDGRRDLIVTEAVRERLQQFLADSKPEA